MRYGAVRAVLSVASVGAAAALITFGLPHVVGVGWTEIADRLGRLNGETLLVLVTLWLAGLWAYTYVLTASLPGLTHKQALALNTTGSAVSNLLPFGGAAGVAVVFAMAGTWGHRRSAVLVSTLVTGVWNVLSRLVLPAVGLACLLAAGALPDPRLTTAAAVASIALIGAVAALLAALSWEWAAVVLGRGLDRTLAVAGRLLPARMRPTPGRASRALLQLRHDTIGLVRNAWAQLTLGMVAYLGLQTLLLGMCLKATGAYPGAAATVAAFALSRALTTVVITPGGVGTSETGTAALLVALGTPAAPAAAAVLLFATFTYVLEIPAGGLAWATWAVGRRRRPRPGQQEAPETGAESGKVFSSNPAA